MNWLPLFAQDDAAAAAAGAGFGLMMIVCWLGMMVFFNWLMYWKVFEKAGQPPVMSLIPIVNLYYLFKIAGRPGWWLVLLLVPLVNIVILILVCIDIAKKFGQGTGFAVGLILLGIIFFPILGFGSAQYQSNAT